MSSKVRLPGKKLFHKKARWLRSRFGRHVLILGYHRIADDDDIYSVCVSPQKFDEQMSALRKYANPISLKVLVEGLHMGQLPPRAVVVTFDDGYVDNLYQAKPILEKYEIPATFFIATGYIGHQFWWDELANIVLRGKSIPSQIVINLNGEEYKKLEPETNVNRNRLLLQIYRYLLNRKADDQQQAIRTLSSQFERDDYSVEMNNRVVSYEELIQMAASELVTVGSHSVSHPVLTNLDRGSLRTELEKSKHDLEASLEQSIWAFSYPNGKSNQEVRNLVGEAEYRCALGSNNDVVRSGGDLLNLPRFWATDQAGDQFSRWLHRWLSK